MASLDQIPHELFAAVVGFLRDPRDELALLSASRALHQPVTVDKLRELQSQHAAAVEQANQAGIETGLDTETAIFEARYASAEDMQRLGSLALSLRKLKKLALDGLPGTLVPHLAAGLDSGSLPSLLYLRILPWPGASGPMEDAGAFALASAIVRGAMPLLETLNLDGGLFGIEGLMRLAASWRQLRSLQTLSLNGNIFGDDGVRLLERMINSDEMPTLREISIIDVDASQVAVDAVRKALLRSIASRPQSVRKSIGAHIKLYSFVVSRALRLPRRHPVHQFPAIQVWSGFVGVGQSL